MTSNSDSSCERRCNRCRRRTNHRVLAQHVASGDVDECVDIDDGGDGFQCVEQERHFEIVQCCGCDEVHFAIRRQYGLHEEDEDPDHRHLLEAEPVESVSEFPGRTIKPLPAWLDAIERRSTIEFIAQLTGGRLTDAEQQQTLPDEVANLLKEIGIAVTQQANALAAMGLRAVIDAVCSDKIGDCGGFKQKLGELVKHGFIAERDGNFLETATQVGHAAAHRGYRPTFEKVVGMLDIVVHMLATMYHLPRLAENLEKGTPPRKQP
ncbi:hypothetical protein LCGC14_0908480 [marine sediment metagenome]|uniref:DUF4145 domain-containing protein n=1 Tax=marine sediment metagenome TaxID=412755 RepID=A0A0F9S141_9ZZZZ